MFLPVELKLLDLKFLDHFLQWVFLVSLESMHPSGPEVDGHSLKHSRIQSSPDPLSRLQNYVFDLTIGFELAGCCDSSWACSNNNDLKNVLRMLLIPGYKIIFHSMLRLHKNIKLYYHEI